MKVKVIKSFRDLKEQKQRSKGDVFEVNQDRLKEINGSDYGILVESIEENDEFPKHTGGGYYELSNGEKVQGKENAFEAENELK